MPAKTVARKYPQYFGIRKLSENCHYTWHLYDVPCMPHVFWLTLMYREKRRCNIVHCYVLHKFIRSKNALNLLYLMVCPKIVQENAGWPPKVTEVQIGCGHFRKSKNFGLPFTLLVTRLEPLRHGPDTMITGTSTWAIGYRRQQQSGHRVTLGWGGFYHVTRPGNWDAWRQVSGV